MEANRENQTRIQCRDQQSMGDPALGSGERLERKREKGESDKIIIQLKTYLLKK